MHMDGTTHLLFYTCKSNRTVLFRHVPYKYIQLYQILFPYVIAKDPCELDCESRWHIKVSKWAVVYIADDKCVLLLLLLLFAVAVRTSDQDYMSSEPQYKGNARRTHWILLE